MRQGQGGGGQEVGILRWWSTRRRNQSSDPQCTKNEQQSTTTAVRALPLTIMTKNSTHAKTRTTATIMRQGQGGKWKRRRKR